MFELKTLRFTFDHQQCRWRTDTPRQKALGISATGKLSVHQISNIPNWMTREEVATKMPRHHSDWDSHLDFSRRHLW